MSSAAPRPNLVPIAAFVSLLVLLLGATGLFALHHTHQKTTSDLARIDASEQRLLLTLRARAAFKTQVQEWKNILLRGRDPKDFITYRERFEKQEAIVRSDLLALDKLVVEEAKAKGAVLKAADMSDHHARLGEAYRAALATFSPSDPEAPFKADATVRGKDRLLSELLDTSAGAVERSIADELAAMSARAAARYEALRRITWIVASFAVLASFWLCFRATRLTTS